MHTLVLQGEASSCRRCVYNPTQCELVYSICINGLYGVKRVSLVDTTLHDFLPLHSMMIRDLCLSPHQPNTLLTASTDRTIKLSKLDTKTVIQR
jgi:WD40 repeat protein